MNTFLNQLQKDTNFTYTENGGLAHKSTLSKVYDLFAFGAAYRNRSDEDVILLFKNAFEEDETLALKCLFYIADARGGQGERRFFRVCFKWLCENHPEVAKRNLIHIPTYRRWDDLIYATEKTKLENDAFRIIKHQLALDIQCETPSLLAKWMPSINASNQETKRVGKKLCRYLGMTEREYRKTLSILRERIKVLEKLMSANRWEEISFDKIPSKAGMQYRNAFARRDIIAKKYEAFAKDKNTKVNADTLYPYEIVAKALDNNQYGSWYSKKHDLTDIDRAMINKYWDNLPDYLGDKECSMLCVVDTSSSMTMGGGASAPINVAISLGLYCAERMKGVFANHYISFASRPQLIRTEGIDFVDKVRRIYDTNLVDNTNLKAVFDLLLSIATKNNVNPNDIPKTIVVISDMEIDSATSTGYWSKTPSIKWTEDTAATMMEEMRQKWAVYGLKLPKLVYWNVDARHNNILDSGDNVSFVSGMSPTIFKQVLTGKSGWDLCIETICADRYKVIS